MINLISLQKNKFILLYLIITFIAGASFLGLKYANYYSYNKVAQAAGAMPWQFGGTVSFYQPVCIATPPDGICKNCLMCGPITGPYICAGYSEVQFTPAGGSMPPNYVCPIQGFVYQGGGVMPRTGGYIIGGGLSAAFPWIIGISP